MVEKQNEIGLTNGLAYTEAGGDMLQIEVSVVPGKGGSHGTPYLYDRTVPLLVRAPGRVAVRAIDQPLPFSTFTHTVAALLGIKPPDDDPDAVDLTAPPASLRR